MTQNIIYGPWKGAKGPWLCLMSRLLQFGLLWLLSFVTAFILSLIKLILWVKFSTDKGRRRTWGQVLLCLAVSILPSPGLICLSMHSCIDLFVSNLANNPIYLYSICLQEDHRALQTWSHLWAQHSWAKEWARRSYFIVLCYGEKALEIQKEKGIWSKRHQNSFNLFSSQLMDL